MRLTPRNNITANKLTNEGKNCSVFVWCFDSLRGVKQKALRELNASEESRPDLITLILEINFLTQR
jgi:hypothetical protein